MQFSKQLSAPALILLLAACGGGTQSTEPTTVDPGETATPGPTVPCVNARVVASVEEACAGFDQSSGAPRVECVRGTTHEADGNGRGDLFLIEDRYETHDWVDHHLALERAGQIQVLGLLGSSFERSCAETASRIIRLEWVADDKLVVDVHDVGQNSCDASPQEQCLNEHGDDAPECEALSASGTIDFDTHVRFLCVGVDVLRCSLRATGEGVVFDPTYDPTDEDFSMVVQAATGAT
jgi:hypothetical protein